MKQPWSKIRYIETKFTCPTKINARALHEQIKTLAGEKYISSDTYDEYVLVRFTEAVTSADKDAVDTLIQEHDPAIESTEDRREKSHAEATTRFKALDIDDIAGQKGSAQIEAIIAALRDIQTILRGAYDVE